ncbi:MAG TPA: N-acetylmuramoyl-L-alanine amidase [Candidatus Udaeobacter sp.]|nr:N-acetylmuramoyl-L-alanine amidase [Candidatus Udaeobacter sp.]
MIWINFYPLRVGATLFIASLGCVPVSTVQARRSSQNSGSNLTVVIDAGHGGYDRGGIPGQRVSEKEMTLDVAQRLKKVLSSNGYHVVMTRDSDVFVPLGTRVAIANAYPGAIFVSIHFNSAKRSGAGGIETYFYSRDSLQLASAIHYYVAGGAPSSNRNVRRRGYYVLRKTRVPAVLVECGFLTNPTEAAYAQTASYRQKLAEEIAAGVRGRNTVSSPLSTTRVATEESIPLQPYIDQTRVSKSERRKSKRSHKKSARRKKSSSKSRGSEAKTSSKNQEG